MHDVQLAVEAIQKYQESNGHLAGEGGDPAEPAQGQLGRATPPGRPTPVDPSPDAPPLSAAALPINSRPLLMIFTTQKPFQSQYFEREEQE